MTRANSRSEPFEQRVRLLRLAWEERRRVRALSRSGDRAAQLALIQALHEWAEAAKRDIAAVYGDRPVITISPLFKDVDSAHFKVTVAQRFTATFLLVGKGRKGVMRWQIEATLAFKEPDFDWSGAPERRAGNWTRGRFEEVLLALLSAYERTVDGDASIGCPGKQSTNALLAGDPGQ